MELEFFGAAGEVTGSCHILRVGGREMLLDCGLVQGGPDPTERNRRPFPFDARRIDAVVLSHAHVDHCGRLPLLVKRGFQGRVFTNPACRDLLPILLRDTASLAEREADRANAWRERRGRAPGNRGGNGDGDGDAGRAREGGARGWSGPERRGRSYLEPLYTIEEAERAIRLVESFPYGAERSVMPGVSVRFRDAGHIMGSSSVEVWVAEDGVHRKLVFSGDLGQYDSPILLDPEKLDSADLVLMESTYGDRLHRDREATIRELGGILEQAWRDGGNVLIPAFAVGRSQELLYLFGRHWQEWQMDRWAIFLDSPMAIEASAIYWKHVDRYDAEAKRLRSEFTSMPALPNLQLTRTGEESREIAKHRRGAIIVAGSGMCNGGRILHHLRNNLWRPECHVVIAAFQAPGTLGRALVDRRPEVRIYGETVRVAATVHTLGGLSAHGDQDDLLQWYSSFASRPPVRLVHGERAAAEGLRDKLVALGVEASIPLPGDRLDLATLTALDPRSQRA